MKTSNNILTKIAQLYYEQLLKHPEAMSYLVDKRCLSFDIVKKYQIGYCPSSDFLVKNYIRQDNGISRVEKLQAVIELNLLKINGYGNNPNPYDFFCGFLTFPIQGEGGEILGFTSRKFIETGNRPKFMHIFYQDNLLYNEKALNYEYVVVVESPICALTLEQNGIPSVAVMGVHRIKKTFRKLLGIKDIYIAFDTENKTVGRNQAERLASLLLLEGKDSFLVELPLLFEKTDVNSYFSCGFSPVYSFKRLMGRAKKASSLDLKSIKPRYKFKKSSQDIVKVVSKYLKLEERSGRFWGTCPFHSGGKEAHASLLVGGAMNIYYCFSCGETGNAEDFVKRISSV